MGIIGLLTVAFIIALFLIFLIVIFLIIKNIKKQLLSEKCFFFGKLFDELKTAQTIDAVRIFSGRLPVL